jgi:DNA-binding CsgD family transcriptional regulator
VFANAIEAAVGAGELERARELTARLTRRACRLESAIGQAGAARGAGLIAATQGEPERAFTAFARSLAACEHGPLPFERARTLLALGTAQRRARQRGAARRTLLLAQAEFARLGTPRWADRARTELERVAGRTPAGSALTASEARIAALVAQGRANKEVAAGLFVSVKTVEASLTRIYPKLGVSSRAGLVRLYASEGR